MQALDAGSAAALPDLLRSELELLQLDPHGGVRHVLDMITQEIKVTPSGVSVYHTPQ